MAPTPQENVASQGIGGRDDEERIVISGMAGLYPQSNNVKELSDILYNKVNPITPEGLRYKFRHPEVVRYGGSVPQLEYFDGQFFKVHYRLGNSMDPMSRKILEQTYQAIYDAGINPEQLYGQKVGVYIGSCYSETEKTFFYDAAARTGLGVAGCNKSMFANRISYWLNAKGPSMSIDDACCSSTVALEQAYLAIKRGECDAAVVGGAYLSLHPQSAVHYGRIMKLCADGKTKSFDQYADGCAKSEAINVLFLQKAKDALRIYAEVLHVKTEFIGLLEGNTGPRYGFYRNPSVVVNYLKKFYEEANVPPQAVEYVEALGSAVPEVDKVELEAIDEVFCNQRDQPLLVGSVISNIGYSEAASGIASITKVLLGYHNGEMAANLHCSKPRKDVEALREGRMRILTDHQRFDGTYTAVNGMSVTGVNSHVLLHGHYKPKVNSRYQSSIPHLVTISGRMESSVKNVIDYLKSRPINPEELALLHNIHQMNITGHLGRGFTILQTNEEQETVSLSEKTEYFDNARRPLWFVYSGMGSQWPGMGTQLMRIPIFAAAIERCHQVLEPKGIDIINILTSTDKHIFDNILHSFVGIAAVQIGLTDVLRELGLQPDGIIGHSLGELGCAYADGCMTAEEMILSAYSRGLVSLQTPLIHGSMAAIGLGYEQISQLCPPDIEVACHNGPESTTISGPADSMKRFVAELTAKGIFAKEVPCSNIAYHSRYIAVAGPGLLKYLSEVLTKPRPRSERWVSTSVPQDRWGEPLAKYSSAEYHTNNLLSPVLFDETSRLIPNNAVLVEIAPHALLQAILKRSLHPSCTNMGLTRRAHPDNVFLVLETIGKLYMEGYNPKVQVLYPKVEFPVSTGTPHLSHLVEWAHGESWPIPFYSTALKKTGAYCNYILSLHDQENGYLRGNVIRGQTLYPFAAALVAVWDTMAMTVDARKKQVSVDFRDVHLHAQPPLHDQCQLRLTVAIHRGNGYFEVLDGHSKVASGVVNLTQDLKDVKTTKNEIELKWSNDDAELTSDDVYHLFEERDYSYSGEFRSIVRASSLLNEVQLDWGGNWVTLIDGMLQLNALRQTHDAVSTPTHIRRMTINAKDDPRDKENLMKVEFLEQYDLTRCDRVTMENIKYYNLPPMKPNEMVLKTKKFIPMDQFSADISTSISIFLQIVAENTNKESLKVVGIRDDEETAHIFHEMRNILDVLAINNTEYKEVSQKYISSQAGCLADVDLLLIHNLSAKDGLCHLLDQMLQPDAFVVSEENGNERKIYMSTFCRVVTSHSDGNRRLALARWRPTPEQGATTAISVRCPDDIKFLKSTRARLSPKQKLLVITSYPAVPGLKELVSRWRKEVDHNKVYMFMASDIKYHDFDMIKLPNLDLVYNVIENNVWGGYYYVPIDDSSKTANNITLQSSQIGNFNSLTWEEVPEPVEDGITVTVHYAGLNYNDIKKSSGASIFKHNIANNYGMDFSGISKTGERVMGIVPSGSCSSRLQAIPELLWPVPLHWSLEDAATVPLAYALAFYCLSIKCRLIPKISILIHGGSGAFGQAIITIALAHGCQVFTTVSDLRKKHFLKKMFPELKDEHIGNSRDESFGDLVLNTTKGAGCDVVIITGSGELTNTTIRCSGNNSYIIDTAQLQTHDKFVFGMNNLNKERSYISVDFSSIFTNENYKELKNLQLVMSEGIARGYVRPLSRVTFLPADAPRAFRLLAASQHRGRVLLKMHDAFLNVKPRIICSPEQCQVILCNSELLDLQLADSLVRRGARNLYLHKPHLTSYFKMKKRSWEKHGVQVEVSSENLNSQPEIRNLLNNALKSGPIQNIYVIFDEKDTDESILTSLDMASRKICPNIKNFIVVNRDSDIGEYTCVSRVRNQLPTKMITLPKQKDCGVAKTAWVRYAVEATERAVASMYSALFAQPMRLRTTTLLQQIADIAEIYISEETPKDVTLEQLGVEEHKLKAVSIYLQIYRNICLAERVIQSLTIEEIRRLDNNELKFENTKGLANFFSFVDSDELFATTEIVFLSTLTDSVSMRDDEINSSKQYLYIVPGMEGHHERFRVLCERLKLPALVLQPGLDNADETPRELAHRYAEILTSKIGVKDNFYLLGYETGVLVALEIASILEDRGLTGTVFCIGHLPVELQTGLNDILGEYKTEEKLQDAVIQHMFTLMIGDITAKLENELEAAVSWPQKVDATVRSLLGRVPHSAQYTRALIETALGRISQARQYKDVVKRLRSKLILLRAATTMPLCEQTLQQYSQQPVVLYQLEAPLAHAATDLRCAAVVNQHLHPDIIEEFNNKNTCETYLLNANCYMTPHMETD